MITHVVRAPTASPPSRELQHQVHDYQNDSSVQQRRQHEHDAPGASLTGAYGNVAVENHAHDARHHTRTPTLHSLRGGRPPQPTTRHRRVDARILPRSYPPRYLRVTEQVMDDGQRRTSSLDALDPGSSADQLVIHQGACGGPSPSPTTASVARAHASHRCRLGVFPHARC
jgi:hypothetical protein